MTRRNYSKISSPSASAASPIGKGTEIYKFEKIKRAKRAALAANPGAELIDMGVGEPDEMAFPDCVAALARAAAKAGQPHLRRQRRRALQRSRRPMDEKRLRRFRPRPGTPTSSTPSAPRPRCPSSRLASSIPAMSP